MDGIDGTDASGTVYCVVDSTGWVLRIGVDPGWWDALGPTGIAGAVLDAVRFAKSKATMARLVLDRYGHPVNAATSGRAAGLAPEPSEPLPPSDSPGFLAALQRELDRTSSFLDAAERFRQERDSGVPRVFEGPNRLFRLVLTGQDDLRAEVNEYGMRRSDGDEIAQDAVAAFRAAASGAQPVAHGWQGRTDD
ncbi:hypothetical protein V1634_25825 [Plantactinospora veratri]|uniref:Uncharacterized protein n=1 Tax=Plantactinospora veratri TaxID=1436122 RepID=A0ABU7SK14_9ACTN